jgi:hypothetical protein
MRSGITACERPTFKKCGISNALDGSEDDDILYEESDASSENNHEVTKIFWVSIMNKLDYDC